jgi:hypothetical protein
LDRWLEREVTCPECRADLLAVTLCAAGDDGGPSTPPLAFAEKPDDAVAATVSLGAGALPPVAS